MATEYRVDCSKKDGPDADRRIDGIGGTSGGGWFKWSQQAINEINYGQSTFYTYVNYVRAEVQVRRHQPSGQDYLTTSPDGYQPNNLLELPNCS
jgi:hypothetical protein